MSGYLTDVEIILVVLGVLYLYEGAWWAPRGAVCFRSWRGLPLAPAAPSEILGNDRGGVVPISPLPAALALIGGPWPVAISPSGVCFVATDAAQDSSPANRYLRFDELKSVTAHNGDVRLGGKRLLDLHSPQLAHRVADELSALAKLKEPQREEAIHDLLARLTDVEAAETRLMFVRRTTQRLGLYCMLLFLFLFFVGPGLAIADRRHANLEPSTAWIFVAICLTQWSIAVTLFYRAYGQLYPGHKQRVGKTAMMALSPAMALRAYSLVSKDSLADFPSITIAGAVCNEEQFRALLRRTILETRHPTRRETADDAEPDAAGVEAAATERWYREAYLQSLLKMLERAGVKPEQILAPPDREGPGVRTYCPRCEAQYVFEQGTCAACTGLALQSFD